MIYIAFAAFLFMLSLSTLGPNRLRRQAYFPVLLAMFVFAAFRYKVGCDWSGYYYQYVAAEYVARDLIAQLNEPLWWIIVEWIKAGDLGYPALNIISSALFFAGVHVLARRQPDPLGFLVLLFPILVVNMPMSGIRQGAAIGLICIAFAAFMDRRPIRFAALVLLAGGLHTSALVFMVLVPLATGTYSKGRLLVAAGLAIPGLLFLAGGYSTGLVIARYIGTGVDAFGAIFRVGVILVSGVYFFVFLNKKWSEKYPQDHSLVNMGAIAIIFAIFLLPLSSVVADRFAYYLIPIQAMIFARVPFFAFKSSKWLHVILPYVALMTMFVGWMLASPLFEQCYLPYDTWLFGTPKGSILKEELFL